jgi:hypothetical protein
MYEARWATSAGSVELARGRRCLTRRRSSGQHGATASNGCPNAEDPATVADLAEPVLEASEEEEARWP